MGIGIGKKCWTNAAINTAPNPGNFEIVREQTVKQNLVLLVKYHGCTNYEGMKLMVYKGFKASKALLKATDSKLDPHFGDSLLSPVARFRPDEWDVAVEFAHLYTWEEL